MPKIEGVEIKELVTHPDERGYFREVIRKTDPFFEEGFAQLSHSLMHPGSAKAWHIHKTQVDWWYVPVRQRSRRQHGLGVDDERRLGSVE